METNRLHAELIKRRNTLTETKVALKKRFLGLDEIIDEVTSLMTPWYLFPEAQIRPTIINMWGLTGSGKTALVQSIVELLDYSKLFSHIDMGEFDSDSASWMKNIFVDDLSHFHQKSAMICMDEFQFARTLENGETEMSKDKLRVVWDVLDSGKIQYIPSSNVYYLTKADSCLKRLQQAVGAGMLLVNGIVEAGQEAFELYFKGFHFEIRDKHGAKPNERYFLSLDFITGMLYLFEDTDMTREDVEKKIRKASAEDIMMMLRDGMATRPATRTMDLSKSVIFVLGNLDEAYAMSKNMNPDISADEFHESTSKITIADIKRALRKRFRPEQIARLGNNHVIYRSFNCAQFKMLITQELNKIGDFVNNQFGWKVIFEKSVVNIVYAEGVFPVQGTRPVFTTVKNLIESRVSNLIVTLLEKQLDVKVIRWKFGKNRFMYEALDGMDNVLLKFSDKAKLKLENLRRSVNPQIQAHTAVHEAGHAVLAVLTLRIIPSVVVSRTASEAEGFCLVNFPKGPMTRETIKKDIVITLGGYIAERMIFGEEMTSSGVYSDIEEASRLANQAVRNYAMGSDPIFLAVESTNNEDAFFITEKYSKEALRIIELCEIEGEQLLRRNKLLLLKISEYLTVNSRMEEHTIEEYVRKYGYDKWIQRDGFVKKNEYYQFDDVLKKEIIKCEEAEAELEDVLEGLQIGD